MLVAMTSRLLPPTLERLAAHKAIPPVEVSAQRNTAEADALALELHRQTWRVRRARRRLRQALRALEQLLELHDTAS
jgi:hypothetical protein